ncbi:MAG: phosphodiester glycosidase family protein, partial [Alistipes sp.]|nr:phosphodiester glycosidase family protein [Alistipes sp.]
GGAFVINNNTPSFKLVDGNADAAALEDANVLVCGPLLWLDGVKQTLAENSDHNSELHPRTAIGVTENGTFLMVAVDGRSTKATGMSNFEMQQLMGGLRAKSALNLDGGGSTEMWEKTNGVVNNPSDGAERAVANIVYVK